MRSLGSRILLILAAPACSLGTTDSSITTGTVHVVVFDKHDEPLAGAEVLVHSDSGELVQRGVTTDDGTLEIGSVANATVTVVRRGWPNVAVVGNSGVLTTFAGVPLDATIRVGRPDSQAGPKTYVDVELPELVPAASSYFVSVGCGGREQLFVSRTARVQYPVSCAAYPRTIVAQAHRSGSINPVAATVLSGVDLDRTTPVQMPAWQPFDTISIDLIGLGAENAILDTGVAVAKEQGSYGAFGTIENGNHVTALVPAATWPETSYSAFLWYFEEPKEQTTLIQFAEAAAPRSVSIGADDVLAPPVDDPDSNDLFAFLFEGNPDVRSIDLTYSCLKCGNFVTWEMFAPPGPDPIELPTLPADLHDLSPDHQIIEHVRGEIFDASEVDGYAEWLGAELPLVPGVTHRTATITLKDFE